MSQAARYDFIASKRERESLGVFREILIEALIEIKFAIRPTEASKLAELDE
jgi:hypothetical protein